MAGEETRRGNFLHPLEATVLNRLGAMRGPGERYSDVILRLVETGKRRIGKASLPSPTPRIRVD